MLSLKVEEGIYLRDGFTATSAGELGAVQPETDTETNARLLNQAGSFVESQGQVTQAAEYLQRALADRQRILGSDHPDTMASRNNLASAYQTAGDLGQAIRCTSRPSPTACGSWAATTPDNIVRGNLAAAPRKTQLRGSHGS